MIRSKIAFTSFSGVSSSVKRQRKKLLYMRTSVSFVSRLSWIVTEVVSADPKALNEARMGIPVTVQRRFDVYSDVGEDQ